MIELAHHILDIAENSIRAGAKLIVISINEDSVKDLLTIEISDDGCGLKREEINKVLDPFYTTKTVRRVGLGLPLLADAARMADGKLSLDSAEGKGTKVKASFQLSHLDRQPMGNIAATMVSLIVANSAIDFIYNHRHNDRRFNLDTRQIRYEIEDVPISHPQIIKYIRGIIEEGLQDIKSEA
jgi:anti-sigma regulatory factor (Ser/Thr protein kinase)